MNSKAEWNHGKLPRIFIETGEKQEEDIENGMCDKRRGTSEVGKRRKELGLETDLTEKRKSCEEQGVMKKRKVETVEVVEVQERVKEPKQIRQSVVDTRRRKRGMQKSGEGLDNKCEEGSWLDKWVKSYEGGIEKLPGVKNHLTRMGAKPSSEGEADRKEEGIEKIGPTSKSSKVKIEKGMYTFTFRRTNKEENLARSMASQLSLPGAGGHQNQGVQGDKEEKRGEKEEQEDKLDTGCKGKHRGTLTGILKTSENRGLGGTTTHTYPGLRNVINTGGKVSTRREEEETGDETDQVRDQEEEIRDEFKSVLTNYFVEPVLGKDKRAELEVIDRSTREQIELEEEEEDKLLLVSAEQVELWEEERGRRKENIPTELPTERKVSLKRILAETHNGLPRSEQERTEVRKKTREGKRNVINRGEIPKNQRSGKKAKEMTVVKVGKRKRKTESDSEVSVKDIRDYFESKGEPPKKIVRQGTKVEEIRRKFEQVESEVGKKDVGNRKAVLTRKVELGLKNEGGPKKLVSNSTIGTKSEKSTQNGLFRHKKVGEKDNLDQNGAKIYFKGSLAFGRDLLGRGGKKSVLDNSQHHPSDVGSGGVDGTGLRMIEKGAK